MEGRTDGSVTISLCIFVGEGIIIINIVKVELLITGNEKSIDFIMKISFYNMSYYVLYATAHLICHFIFLLYILAQEYITLTLTYKMFLLMLHLNMMITSSTGLVSS